MRRRGSVGALLSCVAVAVLVQTIGIVPAGARGATARAVPEMRALHDVACLPDGACLGVGFTPGQPPQGTVIVLHPSGAVGAVRTVPGTIDLHSIACPAGGGCIAVGAAYDGSVVFPVVVEVNTSGVPGAVRPVSGATSLSHVACSTATTCIATGGMTTEVVPGHPETAARFVVITNGRPAAAQPFSPDEGRFWGISCVTSTRCLAVGQGNVAVMTHTRSGGWSVRVGPLTAPGDGSPGDEISCPSATTCHMTASFSIPTAEGSMSGPAIMSVSADGVAGPVQPLTNRPGSLQDISCVAVGTCTLVGQDIPTSGGVSFDVADGRTAAVTFWANSNFFTGVSCVTATSCGIVGQVPQMAVFGWKGPAPS